MIDNMLLSQAKPRILVILQPHPESARLLRAAKRKAIRENLDWEVLVVETAGMHRRLSPQDQETLLSMTTLAEQMGAIVTKLRAKNILEGAKEIVAERAADSIPIYLIKVANIRKAYPWLQPGKPLAKKLRQHINEKIRIVSMPLGIEEPAHHRLAGLLHVNARDILISLFAVAVATAFIELARVLQPEMITYNRNKSIIYLIACVFAAGRYGLLAGIVASVSSFLVLSMLYVAPHLRLILNDPSEAMSLGLFLIASIVVSLLSSRDYGSRLTLAKRADRFHSLFKVHRLALNKNTMKEAILTLDEELKSLLGTEAVFFLPALMDNTKLEITPFRSDIVLNEAEKKALQVCWEECKTTGMGAPYRPPKCRWRFEPLVTAQDEIGVLGVKVMRHVTLDADFGRLLSGISDQVALILERLQVGQLAEKNKIQAEREKLRAMLLSSVSHDLKTPLASVIGSLSVYRSMGKTLPEEHRVTLINTALNEAQRLDSFITNILDMTRIESGQIELKQEWIKPEELVTEVCRRLRERLRDHTFCIAPPAEPLEASMDSLMTGQVIQNLLDNAAKYTNPGTKIEVSWARNGRGLKLQVRDHGKGIPEEQLEKIFDKYARVNRQDHQVAGTGLGLAIARAIMQSQGGNIVATNHPQGGAIFTITIPHARPAEKKKAA